MTSSPQAALPWYAIRVRSNFEVVTAAALEGRGYEQLLPTYKTRSRRTDRVKDNDRPLFPGYVFSRFDFNNRLPVLTCPGVVNVVTFGSEPAVVDPVEIETIRSIVSSGLGAQPWPYLKVGRKVLIEQGPLKGIEGLVVEVRRRFHLIVSVSLLQRSVSVQVEREWVRPLGTPEP